MTRLYTQYLNVSYGERFIVKNLGIGPNGCGKSPVSIKVKLL